MAPDLRPGRILGWAAVPAAVALVARATRRSARSSAAISWAPPAGRPDTEILAVRILGEGLPATVLLHGMFASGQYWGAAYDELGAETMVVVPDLAGFGRSVDVTAGYGPDDHADLVAETLRHLGAAGAPVVIGAHSLGCLVALRLAARHPELVAGIVGFSPPLYSDPDAARRSLGRAHFLVRLFALSPRLSEAACRWIRGHRPLATRLARLARPDLPEALAKDRLKHTYLSYSTTLAKVIVAAGTGASIDRLRVPVHLVAGDKDTVVDLAYLAELEACNDGVSLAIWPGAGHEVPLTHPSQCLAEMRRLRVALAAEPVVS